MSMPLDCADIMIPEIFASHGVYRAAQEAVVCGAVRRNWSDFSDNIRRVSNGLLGAGVQRGDRVAVMMDNAVDMLEIVFGVVAAGACVVPLSGLLTGEQLAGLLNNSGAVAAFAHPSFIERLAPHEDSVLHVRPGLRYVVDGEVSGWHPFGPWLSEQSSDTPPVTLHPDDAFNIIYSSGTTGLPKGIVQTHRARTHWAVSNAIEMGFSDQSRALTTTALYSNGTWLMMLPVLFAGGTCVVMPSFDAADFVQMVQAERISHSFLVPAQYIAVLQQDIDPAHVASLHTLLCAGSPLRRETKREVVATFGPKLIELYGFSEGFATMLKPSAPEDKFHTVGTPVLGFELRILSDEGQALARGEVGEIAGYGPGMMARYHDNDEATQALIWRDERGRSFIRSGDVGYLDAEGYLVLVDRKKDMIISGGFNVFPADIEEIVGQHPDVQDVTVIGVPHARWGETPLALVIPQPGAQVDVESVCAWANSRLAKHQRLSAVECRDSFPRNALGKVLKRILRDPYWVDASA